METQSETITRQAEALNELRVLALWNLSPLEIRGALAGAVSQYVAVCDPDTVLTREMRQQLADENVLVLHVPAAFTVLPDNELAAEVRRIVAVAGGGPSFGDTGEPVHDESDAEAVRSTQVALSSARRNDLLALINDLAPDDDGVR